MTIKKTEVRNPNIYLNGGMPNFSSMANSSSGTSSGGSMSGAPLQMLFSEIDKVVQGTNDIAKAFIPKEDPAWMVSRRALRGYDLGGALNVANTAVQQVASAVNMGIAVDDKAKAVKEDIKGNMLNPTSSRSTTDLLNQWSSWNPTNHITWKDLTNKGSILSTVTDGISMGSQGAVAGSALGAPGAIAAGIGGTVAGVFGNLFARHRAKKQERKINNIIDSQNLSTQRAFTNQASQLDEEMVAKDLADFTGWNAAFGGPLHAFGGELNTHGGDFTNGLIFINNGGTHEQNPYEGVPIGVDNEGISNLVEEGEVIFKDYVFSNRMKIPSAIKNKYKLGGFKSLTFADAAKKLSSESEERPNDPISITGLNTIMQDLIMAQEELRAKKTDKQGRRRFDWGGPTADYVNQLKSLAPDMDQSAIDRLALASAVDRVNRPLTLSKRSNMPLNPNVGYTIKTNTPVGIIETPLFAERNKSISDKLKERASSAKTKEVSPKDKGKKSPIDLMRFAPAVGQGVQALTDALGLTNRPEYTLGKRIREANNQIRGIETRAAGQRIGYKPVDQWSAINNFNSQMAAQRSALRNAGNRVGAAGQLLSSAYNQNQALGALYAGMERENWDRLSKAVAHNTSVDQANRAAELDAARANAAQGNIRAQNLITAAKADDDEESAYAAAKAANKGEFLNTLGSIGKEKIDREMIRGLIESGYFGTQSDAMLNALGYLGVSPQERANGGKIKRKKKGLTY